MYEVVTLQGTIFRGKLGNHQLKSPFFGEGFVILPGRVHR